MHLTKIKRTAAAAMLHHYKRDLPGTLRRENINPARTPQNYTLGRDLSIEDISLACDRHNEKGRALRKDAVVMADICLTLPRNVPERHQETFFRESYAYLVDLVGGEDNIIGGYVHMDETRPHMHFAFMPRLGERFNFKALCPRTFYQSLHLGLETYLEDKFGYKPAIMLEPDDPDRALHDVRQRDLDGARRALDDGIKEQHERLERLRREGDAAEERNQGLALEAGNLRAEVITDTAGGRNLVELRERVREATERNQKLREQRDELAAATHTPNQAQEMASLPSNEEIRERSERARARIESAGERSGSLRERIRSLRDRLENRETLTERIGALRERVSAARGRYEQIMKALYERGGGTAVPSGRNRRESFADRAARARAGMDESQRQARARKGAR